MRRLAGCSRSSSVSRCSVSRCSAEQRARTPSHVLPSSAAAPTPYLPALKPNFTGSVSLPFDLSTTPVSPLQLEYPQLLRSGRRPALRTAIPWQVLASINKVESNFGRHMGPSSAGAIGWIAVHAGTWLRWGTDANGDVASRSVEPGTTPSFSAARLSRRGRRHDRSLSRRPTPTTTPTGT